MWASIGCLRAMMPRTSISSFQMRKVPSMVPLGVSPSRIFSSKTETMWRDLTIQFLAVLVSMMRSIEHEDAAGISPTECNGWPGQSPPHHGGGDNPNKAIKVIEAEGLGFCLGNAIKYISRAGKKGNRLKDLRKAGWYFAREIQNLEADLQVAPKPGSRSATLNVPYVALTMLALMLPSARSAG